tara:strand:+ start:270 stop:371 length:102 start_codon:yes stop_codon:yes gene_type:complete
MIAHRNDLLSATEIISAIIDPIPRPADVDSDDI